MSLDPLFLSKHLQGEFLFEVAGTDQEKRDLLTRLFRIDMGYYVDEISTPSSPLPGWRPAGVTHTHTHGEIPNHHDPSDLGTQFPMCVPMFFLTGSPSPSPVSRYALRSAVLVVQVFTPNFKRRGDLTRLHADGKDKNADKAWGGAVYEEGKEDGEEDSSEESDWDGEESVDK